MPVATRRSSAACAVNALEPFSRVVISACVKSTLNFSMAEGVSTGRWLFKALPARAHQNQQSAEVNSNAHSARVSAQSSVVSLESGLRSLFL
jgi:hypothetical protein